MGILWLMQYIVELEPLTLEHPALYSASLNSTRDSMYEYFIQDNLEDFGINYQSNLIY